MTVSIRRGYALLAAILMITVAAQAVRAGEDPCAAFSWNVSHERELFAASPEAAVAGREASLAPLLALDRLYEPQLAPEGQVVFVVPPERSRPATDNFGGVVRLRADIAGTYRIFVNQGLWIDIVAKGRLIASNDFQGRAGCQAPHKIVQYVLPGEQDLVLQLSGGRDGRVRIAITRLGSTPAA
jgi:hypothetical protein